MKQCHLHNPLVNSVVLITVLSLLIGLMLFTGGFFSGIWAFFVLIFQTIQWSIALTLGILVCLVALIAIFIAAAAMHDRSSAIRIFEGLRGKVTVWVNQARAVCPYTRTEKVSDELEKSPATSGFADLVDNVQEEVSDMIESTGTDVVAVREEFDRKIEELNRQLKAVQDRNISPEHVKAVASEMVESTGADVVAVREEFEKKIKELSSQLQAVQSDSVTPKHVRDTVAGEVITVKEAVGTADAGLKELHTRVDDIAGKLAAMKPDDIIGDIPVRLERLEKQEMPAPVDIKPVQEQIAALQAEVTALKVALAEAHSSAVDDSKKEEEVQPAPAKKQEKNEQTGEHRLLSYYDTQEDKEKLSDMVVQTLKKDMTYAQVMTFLIEEMGEEGGKVISEHPSLAKDYIRQCRRNA